MALRASSPRLPLFLLFTLPALANVACGGSTSLQSAPSATHDDAGEPTASPPSDPGAADAALTIPTPPFVSNTPGAIVVDVGSPTPSLVLVSSNLVRSPDGSAQPFQEWFGLVENVGPATLCAVTMSAAFESSMGATIAGFAPAYVDDSTYVLTSTSSATDSCLAPGETGGLYTNAILWRTLPVDSISRIAVTFTSSPLAAGEEPAPQAPTIGASILPMAGGYGLAGALRGGSAEVSDISLVFYTLDPTGLVLGRLSASDTGSLQPDGTYSFATTSVTGRFAKYLATESFLIGPSPPAP